MPRYDYRCTTCGTELEISHRMNETVAHQAHQKPSSDEPCDGELERLIAASAVQKTLRMVSNISDSQLKNAGFTKYVKSDKGGYERAFGPERRIPSE